MFFLYHRPIQATETIWSYTSRLDKPVYFRGEAKHLFEMVGTVVDDAPVIFGEEICGGACSSCKGRATNEPGSRVKHLCERSYFNSLVLSYPATVPK